MTAMLEVDHACFTYSRQSVLGRRIDVFKAVDDVSLSLGSGQILGVVGESGSGKSTLAKLLLGLLPLTAGEIRLLGRPRATYARREASRLVQPVFQDPYSSLNPRLSIAKAIQRPLDIHSIGSSSERTARVRYMMDCVGLSQRLAESYPAELSGGQRQRVAIARAMAIGPKLLICDEPTSALDVSIQSQIVNLIRDLTKELGMSCMFITHNMLLLRYIADDIAVMKSGRMVDFGTAIEIMVGSKNQYTRKLVNSIMCV